jgi:hypothetical protein
MLITINDEGLAAIEFVAAFDISTPALTARPDQEQLTGPELFAELGVQNICASTPGGAAEFTTTPFSEGRMRGVRCSATGVDVTALKASSADGTELLIDRTDTAQGSTWSFRASIPDQRTAQIEAAPLPDIDALLKISLTVSAPGQLIAHNGTQVDANTVRWELTNPSPETEQLTAAWFVAPQEPAPLPAATSSDEEGDAPRDALINPVVRFWVGLSAGLVAGFVLIARTRRPVWSTRRKGSRLSELPPRETTVHHTDACSAPSPNTTTADEPAAQPLLELSPVKLPPAGWYQSLSSPTGRRFWDGSAWTDQV